MKFYFKHGVIGRVKRGTLKALQKSLKEQEEMKQKLRYAYEDLPNEVDEDTEYTEESEDETEVIESAIDSDDIYYQLDTSVIESHGKKKRRKKSIGAF